MMIRKIPQRYKLDSNPFEPSATGAPIWGGLKPLGVLAEHTSGLVDLYRAGTGVKGIIVVGEYGMGKTCLLDWLHSTIFPSMKVKSFYFHNPGVHFYDLANHLLKSIGRKDFAKFIWELASSYVTSPYQGSLFETGFEAYLSSISSRGRQSNSGQITSELQAAIRAAGVTEDEQIAYCLARIAIEVPRKPYFEYRDFVPRHQGNIVAEGEEAPYFSAVLRTICAGTGSDAVAFLVDEFEEIGLQQRLNRRAASDYLATLKRLINLAQSEEVDFWVILSMTQDAYRKTSEIEPSLVERFSDRKIEIAPLSPLESRELMARRISSARTKEWADSTAALFPFPEQVEFRPSTYSNPRKLVKACFRALAQADSGVALPFSRDYLRGVEDRIFPTSATGDH